MRAPDAAVEPVDGAADPSVILDVRDLRVWFRRRAGLVTRGTVKAVDGVGFQIRRGETLGLVGESGSGKTTTARAVLRLVPPTSGQILFDGQDLTKLSGRGIRRARRNIQAVFQNPYASLNPRRRVREIVAEPLIVHKIGHRRDVDKRVADLMEIVGLDPDQRWRYPHAFSGGQRQRIAIARALAARPSMIVCDEAVSALDVSVQAQIINLLKSLQQEYGISLLFISHDLGVIRNISHRVAVMYLGRIVEMADGDAIYDSPQHPYTSALLSSVLTPQPSVERVKVAAALPGSTPNPAAPPPGCHFSPRCPSAFEPCPRVEPELRLVAPDHQAACHLHGLPEA